jgi:hypothetical protein
MLGRAMGAALRRYLATRPAEWRGPATPDVGEMQPFIERYAPETLRELEGFADGAGVERADVLRLTIGYDQFMARVAAPAKCTAFAAMGSATADGALLCGQNNDEGPEWVEFELDHVARHVEPDGFETLIYTHAGMPAYMGLNAAGLCVLWLTILDRDTGPGVPTTVLLREVLRRRTLGAALQFLRETPRYCPNAFLLAHATDGLASLECSHRHFSERRSPVALCHANHVIHADYGGQCLLRGDPVHTTHARQARMERLVTEHHGRLDLAAAQRFLRSRADGKNSILSRAEDGFGWQTIASLVFRPAAGELWMAFGPEEEAEYHRYALRRESG